MDKRFGYRVGTTHVTKRAIPLDAARVIAAGLIHYLEPVCERIEIAGSMRRGKETVGDIELVAKPRMHEPEQRDLFGNPVGALFDRIDEAINAANAIESKNADELWLKRLNNGTRYLKLHDQYMDVQIDLFMVRPPAEWGPIFAIRTGPADFSQKLVKGLHVRKMKCEDGRVLDARGKLVSCPDEETFFRACGFRWKEPGDRR